MRLNQNKPQETKKIEEQIREDMRRKWDNFGATQSSKIKEEKEQINQNTEDFNNNTDNIPSHDEKKEEEKEEEKYEEEKEEKKPMFLSLKPRPEEEKEENNEELVKIMRNRII